MHEEGGSDIDMAATVYHCLECSQTASPDPRNDVWEINVSLQRTGVENPEPSWLWNQERDSVFQTKHWFIPRHRRADIGW